MEARFFRAAILAGALSSFVLTSLATSNALGASSRTQNFVVSAHTQELADEIARAAEKYRRDLAIEWLGREMPAWREPCPINATVNPQMGAGGATTFMFDADASGQPQVFGWKMSIQGSRERVLDSVLPHEVTHTIFATHFRRPLPRWADEGGSTTVEHVSERAKQHAMLITFLKTSRGIPFDQMFAMKEYPRDIMPLYAQGYATARFLIAQGGKQEFVRFLASGFEREDWAAAVKKHYGYEDLGALQNTWLEWIKSGGSNQIATQFMGRKSDSKFALASTSKSDAAPRANERTDANVAASRPVPQEKQVASAGGWYARGSRQSENRANNDTAIRPAPLHEAAADPLPSRRDVAAREPIAHEATHPQPIEPARQVILEWNRPMGTPPASQPANGESGTVLR